MAFKLTYTDGNENDYDDNTKWEVDAGVVKLGREEGKWTVFVSPSHWATLELASSKDEDEGDGDGDGDGEEQDQDEDEDEDEDS